MSTAQLQSALVTLIRYPELNRGQELEDFIGRYELSPKEQWQVRSLATSYYVAKFGRDQRATRFDLSVNGVFPLTCRVVGVKIMARDIYGLKFEPFHEGLPVSDISRVFAEFFIENAEKFILDLKLPEYVGDLAKYEYAEYWIKGPFCPKEWKVSKDSLLKDSVPLKIDTFNFDVQTLASTIKKADSDEALKGIKPEKKDLTLLFARIPKEENAQAFLSKQFAIDASLSEFFKEEMLKVGESGEKRTLPEAYPQLVKLGLCRSL